MCVCFCVCFSCTLNSFIRYSLNSSIIWNRKRVRFQTAEDFISSFICYKLAVAFPIIIYNGIHLQSAFVEWLNGSNNCTQQEGRVKGTRGEIRAEQCIMKLTLIINILCNSHCFNQFNVFKGAKYILSNYFLSLALVRLAHPCGLFARNPAWATPFW